MKYKVQWIYVNIEKQNLDSEIEQFLIGVMCLSAADGLELQCSRECWAEIEDGQRAPQIHKLTKEQRENLPTENLCAERYLARFGVLTSNSARHSNNFFKAKRIRDDLTLSVDDECNNAPVRNQKPFATLDSMEKN